MPIGFPAYDEDREEYRGYERKQLLRAAEDALDDLDWPFHELARYRLRAHVPNEVHGILWTWGAKLTVDIDDEEIAVRSEGAFALAWLDLGQHRRNVVRFLKKVERYLARD